ncbi:hypothetical protein THASP1DRAFT_12406 [Thamnocephalis sphaerospora]|uniref:PARP catalytic domain-containing protein n=1 Tax=Thamnocephalis sphaerospora TaxID=78915 RepID=A0A4P9XWK7_9FUNG|nr:hypothetical protein THASP1DRAFT_12406 [Thamnocephalis sphaerospora]|eukprot:RKP10755.1 hypothetical protein THASP1DRAFT_12406 [Thamnocephalis sphaerospora]
MFRHARTSSESSLTEIHRTEPCFADAERQFNEAWVKKNATNLRVERIFSVRTANDHTLAHQKYRQQIAESLGLTEPFSRQLFHGTDFQCSLLAHLPPKGRTTAQHRSLCQLPQCAGCGIVRNSFRMTHVGQNRRSTKWQRLGHGIYFSPWSSKCHYYGHPGECVWPSDSDGDSKRRVRVMFLADVVLGISHQPHQPEYERTELPTGYHSSHGRAGTCGLNYEEYAVFSDVACMPRYLYIYSFTETTE